MVGSFFDERRSRAEVADVAVGAGAELCVREPALRVRDGGEQKPGVRVERLCEHTTAGSCSGPQVERLAGRSSANGIPAPNTTNQPKALVLEPNRSDAAALGSIVAAAWTNNPAVPATAALVTHDVAIAPDRLRRAAELTATDDGGTAWSADQLLASARLEAFARWLARATHERVRLEEGYEHPGDASQPDNLHEH